ncbi:MAG: dihydrofolate reductase [Balneolaceae bacterium]
MTLCLIAAHDPDLLIGADGELPWHYPEDMKHFVQTTKGHPVIMGRGVFEEIGEKPLPGRENFVVTRSRSYDQVRTCRSISEALDLVTQFEKVFVIGGSEIYRQTIDRADELYITEIHQKYDGDRWFPEYRDKISTVWEETERRDGEELSFVKYRRKWDYTNKF